jgi:heavy metal translocating P-type ATPase
MSRLLLIAVTVLLAAGGLAVLVWPEAADPLWMAGTVVALVPAVVWAGKDLLAKRFGADLLAVFALAGTLLVGEFLAGSVIGVMLGTGQVLDDYARRRARRDLSALLDRAPRQARVRAAGQTQIVPVAEVVVGQTVIVASGEVIPVDGRLQDSGVFDESALTGEPMPVNRARGEEVRSGVVNAGPAVELTATAKADESTYAGVMRLAEQAAAESAPVVRLADRIAAVFLPVALVIAAAAWFLSGDPVRAVAVLVTATPCPLLLAAPIAITAGMSRASRLGVVLKHGAALEALGRARTAVLDKTGTVTVGRPKITDVLTAPGHSVHQVLSLAAAVEQLSAHVLATAVVRAAGPDVAPAQQVTEHAGIGAAGFVDGHRVTVGRPESTDLPHWARAAVRKAELDMASTIWVSLDGEPIGVLLARDEIRPDAARTLRRLRAAGLRRIVLLTGDRLDNAQDAGILLGLDELWAGCSPADKVARVREERSRAVTLMVGDGINDAPALAAADVGIGLAGRDATAAAQAADAVITDGRIARLADAVEAASRAHRIAVQSAGIGITLSLVAMVIAAMGWLVPVAGAVAQEGIDVAVILNALRALLPVWRIAPDAEEILHRFEAEHEQLMPARRAVRQAADALSDGLTPEAEHAVRRAYRLVDEHLLPHELAEDRDLYPVVAALLGGPEATQAMSRGHVEIERQVRRLGRHLSAPDGVSPDQIDDLRATLYGLDAILTLHFAQEEEDYFTLAGRPR